MDAMMFILPLIGGLLLYAVISAAVKAPGVSLRSQFQSLGVVKGKTLSQIAAVVGNPSAISYMGDGTILRQWQATGYHVALLFDSNEICLGISQEISV